MQGSPYDVIVCDLFHLHDPNHETIVEGFPTRELAIEYTRRRTWSSLDQMRAPGLSREQVRSQWLALGENCRVVGAGRAMASLVQALQEAVWVVIYDHEWESGLE